MALPASVTIRAVCPPRREALAQLHIMFFALSSERVEVRLWMASTPADVQSKPSRGDRPDTLGQVVRVAAIAAALARQLVARRWTYPHRSPGLDHLSGQYTSPAVDRGGSCP
jgi:hypothetical protein